MRSIETLIEDMKAIRDIHREHVAVANNPTIKELAITESTVITDWILRLEESHRLVKLNSSSHQALHIALNPPDREAYFDSLIAD